MPLHRCSASRAPTLAAAVLLAAVIWPGLLVAQPRARAGAQTPAHATAGASTKVSAETPGRPAVAEPPVCDTTPPPPRWADQFRRHAVAAPASAHRPSTTRARVASARPVRRPGRTARSAAPVTGPVAAHRPAYAPVYTSRHAPAAAVRKAAARPHRAGAHAPGSGVPVRKPQTACPTRVAGVSAGDLAPPAYGDALKEAFGAPLSGEVSEAPTVGPLVGIESGGEVDAGAAVPTPGGPGARSFSLPRLGWGTLVVGGVGFGVAAVPGGGSSGGTGGWPGSIDWNPESPSFTVPTGTAPTGGSAGPAMPGSPAGTPDTPQGSPLASSPPAVSQAFAPPAPPPTAETLSEAPTAAGPAASHPAALPDTAARPSAAVPTEVVPEPASAVLLAGGLAAAAAAGAWRRRRR